MKEFKEWLSDNLRYFMLGLAVIILLVLIFLGFRLIKNITSEPAAKTGRETETSKETESETQQETKTEKNTEKETESEKEQPTPDSRQTSETEPAETEEVQTQAPVTEAPQTEVAQTEAPQTEAPQTDPPQTEADIPPEPVYITTNGAVYIREAPSYEGEILGVLEAGQTVEFLEDAQGWYKVNADGLIGYVGARFFY
ncbi:SH3 domain-containing protein [Murimonas intestini]|uniref:SH3 domain-containing protein n=1 Tax=Murimonas intestini TaxID=1337051 RepID=A0AB73T913_9FIRM|nr:SH3 domain-containing protein [Murimonas intestini]MCR1839459.1 SH3 domain-containing protein [Murimonas intestini]MCR1864754.1 SH3 domain-containing protein [Murimonas intestini]MCR1882364.1 SH3 domain-containing protein [Murimonas intestini]